MGAGLMLALLASAAPPPAFEPAGTPDSPEALRAALEQRRRESPPLTVLLRIAQGSLAGEEETEESLVTLRWMPEGWPERDAAARAPRPPPPEPLDKILADLDPPLLRPAALKIRDWRRTPPPAVQPARPGRAPARRPSRALEGLLEIVPAPPPPRRPLPTEIDLARSPLRLTLDHPAGALDAVLDPGTLHLERLTWGSGRDRAIVLVESIQPAGDEPLPPLSTGRPRTPPRAPSPPHGVLLVALRPADAAAEVLVSVQGFTVGIQDEAIVDVRTVVTGDDLDRGPWEREAGRLRVSVRDGRFEAVVPARIDLLVSGRAGVVARRVPAGTILAGASLAVPPDMWSRALLRDLRAAGRLLRFEPGTRRIETRHLAAVAALDAWPLLPATRRAIESRLQGLAASGPEASPAGNADAGAGLRDLLAREARWAILERASSAPIPRPPHETDAIRRVLAEAPPPADPDLDASIATLLGGEPPAGGPSIDDLKQRLRAAGP